MTGVFVMVKQLAESIGLVKNMPVAAVIVVGILTFQWMNNESARDIARSNNAALERAVDRLIESNAANVSAIAAGHRQIIDNQTRIIANTEVNTRAADETREVLKEQLDVSKETLTIIKMKGIQ